MRIEANCQNRTNVRFFLLLEGSFGIISVGYRRWKHLFPIDGGRLALPFGGHCVPPIVACESSVMKGG